MEWQHKGVPLVVVAGKEYGTGSSRDWAAKGTALLGVKAVIAESFERIHRSNLVGMGVIPLEFTGGEDRHSLGLTGEETITITGLEGTTRPRQTVKATITYADGKTTRDRPPLPDRYRGRDRLCRERRRAALCAEEPRQGGLTTRPGARARRRVSCGFRGAGASGCIRRGAGMAPTRKACTFTGPARGSRRPRP